MSELNLIQKIAIWAIPVIFAITVHEVAHGWVANRRGDATARMLGRLTLNPIKHIDPMGTIVVPILLLATGGFLFGWAKPVPVNMRNLRSPDRDMALVAAAGPGVNLLMALGWGLLLKMALLLLGAGNETVGVPLAYMAQAGIAINLVLMILNLLPIPPLDGSRILRLWLPDQARPAFDRLETWGLLILIGLLALGWLGYILSPPMDFMNNLIFTIFAIHP